MPLEPLFKSRKRVEQCGFDRFHRKHWHQADERAHAHPEMSPARRVQHIIVKFVLLVPEPYTFSPKVIHRGGNTEEVLEELCCDIFVNGIFTGELQRDPQHIEAKHSHPACAIAL